MIVRMNKYTFVVMQSQRQDFLESLQRLGMVDVTTTGWEPGEDDSRLMTLMERYKDASEHLVKLSGKERYASGEPYGTGAEAFDKYSTARKRVAELRVDIAAQRKLAADIAAWGPYNPDTLKKLAAQGVVVRFFTAYDGDFEKKRREWRKGRIIEVINSEKGTTYFAVITTPEDEVLIDAHEVKLPSESLAAIEEGIVSLTKELRGWDKVFADAAASLSLINAEHERLKDLLQFKQAADSGKDAAEGSLVVMEAWARESQEAEVDEILESYPAAIYIKEKPTMDDATPVELKNNRFASPFEFIGDLYARPRYGKMDLTRWFAPFFMLFFGMCLADLGYGALIFAAGLTLTLTAKKDSIKGIGRLTMWCGGAAIVVGFILGSLFGAPLGDMKIFEPVKKIFLDQYTVFYLAIAIGVFQILFAMVLNIVATTRAFGIRNALSAIGWFVMLVAAIAQGARSYAEFGEISFGSIPFWASFGAGLFMVLFLNNISKNPLLNLGGGLWTLFNNVTGLLGDALSYIRLFAIGLSGGVLAMVFNKIAFSVSPDVPVVGQIVTLVILIIGHSLNLFMSTLSGIVHPLRLTFVEFYKNSGFEATERVFNPLRKSK